MGIGKQLELNTWSVMVEMHNIYPCFLVVNEQSYSITYWFDTLPEIACNTVHRPVVHELARGQNLAEISFGVLEHSQHLLSNKNWSQFIATSYFSSIIKVIFLSRWYINLGYSYTLLHICIMHYAWVYIHSAFQSLNHFLSFNPKRCNFKPFYTVFYAFCSFFHLPIIIYFHGTFIFP